MLLITLKVSNLMKIDRMGRNLFFALIAVLGLDATASAQQDSLYKQELEITLRTHFGEFSETHLGSVSVNYFRNFNRQKKNSNSNKWTLQPYYGGGIIISVGKDEAISGSTFNNPELVIPNLRAGLSLKKSRVALSASVGPGIGFYGRQRPFFVLGDAGMKYQLSDTWGVNVVAGLAIEPGSNALSSAGVGISRRF